MAAIDERVLNVGQHRGSDPATDLWRQVTALTCLRCNLPKPPTDFPRDSSRASGRKPVCRECESPKAARYQAANADRIDVTAPAARPVKLCRSGCGRETPSPRHWYCVECRRASKRIANRIRNLTRPSTTAQGYGYQHQQLRKRVGLLVSSGQAACARCGLPIAPGEAWDLDHTEDRSDYNGPAHASCNRTAGAKKASRPVRSREW